MMVVALGLASPLIVARFFSEVAYDTIRVLRESYTVAHELVLGHFRGIEEDATRTTTLANVVERSSQDTLLRRARSDAGTFFRPPAEGHRGAGAQTWNGKSTDSSKQLCIAYNLGSAHQDSALRPDGTCKYAHRCSQFVTDKGKGGQCLGHHPRIACTYDTVKKCARPLK